MNMPSYGCHCHGVNSHLALAIQKRRCDLGMSRTSVTQYTGVHV